MVSTRSQDSNLQGIDEQAPKEHMTSSTRSRKRKTKDESDATPSQATSKKRRVSARSKAATSTPGPAGIGRDATIEHANEPTSVSPKQKAQAPNSPTDELQGNNPASTKTPSSATSEPNIEDGLGVIGTLSQEQNEGGSFAEDGSSEGNNETSHIVIPRTTRKSKTPRKARNNVLKENLALVGKSKNNVLDESTTVPLPVKAAKVTHKRFGSEDIEIPELHIQEAKTGMDLLRDSLPDANDESEDEPPETVTASAGFEKARMATLEAAKVVARQGVNQKAKRREHDLLLKQQARTAKKQSSAKHQTRNRSPEAKMVVPEEANDGNIEAQAKPKIPGKPPLPVFLPDEILAADPVTRPRTRPPSTGKTPTNRQRKFLDIEPKPPRDIKVGNVKVRVLDNGKSILPPKVSQAGRALRESWLLGRPGLKGSVEVPRRKLGSGFVRR